MRNSIILFFCIALYSLANAQHPPKVKLYSDKTQSSITYAMRHPLHSFSGTSKDITSVILTDANRDTIDQVAVNVRISSFDSKNANRDSHVIEATEALKFPNVSFSSSSIRQENNKLTVTGILIFHGVSQTVTCEAEKKTINNKMQIEGNFTVLMTQFKIKPPSLLGIATNDEIKISFKVIY